MFQILVNFVFKIISIIGSIILTPLMALVTPLFSAFGVDTTSIINWFQEVFSFVPFILVTLHIPQALFSGVLAFASTIFVFNISLKVVGMIQAVYYTIKGPTLPRDK